MENRKAFREEPQFRWRGIQIAIGAVMMLIPLTACERLEGGSGLRSTEAAAWIAPLQRVHEALARKDIGDAEWAWHEAYVAALRSQSWESMVQVGDAALSIGEVARFPKGSADRARQSYLVALSRARFQRSLDGLLRTAEAFAALGDREAVDQCLYLAKSLAARLATTRMDLPSVLDHLFIALGNT